LVNIAKIGQGKKSNYADDQPLKAKAEEFYLAFAEFSLLLDIFYLI
jgi:hypothetical protein